MTLEEESETQPLDFYQISYIEYLDRRLEYIEEYTDKEIDGKMVTVVRNRHPHESPAIRFDTFKQMVVDYNEPSATSKVRRALEKLLFADNTDGVLLWLHEKN